MRNLCFHGVTAARFQNERNNNNNIFFRRLIERSLQNARNVYKFFRGTFCGRNNLAYFKSLCNKKREKDRVRERDGATDKQMIEAGEVGGASKDCSQNSDTKFTHTAQRS